MTGIHVPPAVLDALLPFALIFDPRGRIAHAGPTLERIAPGTRGLPLDRVVRMRRPAGPATPDGLLARADRPMAVDLPLEKGDGPPTRLRAVALPLGGGRGLLRLAFGADVRAAIARHALTAQDFAALDPTVEILFLLEAQAAVQAEFRSLSARLEEARQAAETMAVTDKLTGLSNRRAVDGHLARLSRMRSPRFGLVHLDLDHFKAVNDTHGHAAGDHVLETVARILTEEVRRGDTIGRVGGDEFVVILEDCVDRDILERISRRIIDRLEEPISWDGQETRISGSIGIAISTAYRRPDPERLMADADAALYDAKKAGRGRHAVATPNAQGKG